MRLAVALLIFGPVVVYPQPISADALKADVSFLASDAMQGRGVLSPTLDIAAEYIAAQFRRAGLDASFQSAEFKVILPAAEGVSLSFNTARKLVVVDRARLSLRNPANTELTGAAALAASPAELETLDAAAVKGRALVVTIADPKTVSPTLNRDVAVAAKKLEPSVVILLRNGGPLIELQPRIEQPSQPAAAPWILVSDADAYMALTSATVLSLSLRIPPPQVVPVTLRNVIGVLRGSDGALRESYVIVSAHYDHLGVRVNASGDTIYNGAIDNASGTASLIQIAAAFASAPERPKRTIVFIAFTAEEYGMAGSRYYCRHPVIPLASTVANINLEQTARPGADSPLELYMTGFSFTNLSQIMATGDITPLDSANSDRYFTLSDNLAFAEVGVPSTTLSAIFSYPDYHRPGDEWQKLDYDGMARFTEAAARGILAVANSAEPPKWNEANPKAAPYSKPRYPR